MPARATYGRAVAVIAAGQGYRRGAHGAASLAGWRAGGRTSGRAHKPEDLHSKLQDKDVLVLQEAKAGIIHRINEANQEHALRAMRDRTSK